MRVLRERGYLAMGGQIVDATIVEARRPRLTQGEKDTLRSGGTPAEWKPARRAQIDRDGRWSLKRGKKRDQPPAGGLKRAVPSEIVIPAFGFTRLAHPLGVEAEGAITFDYPTIHLDRP